MRPGTWNAQEIKIEWSYASNYESFFSPGLQEHLVYQEHHLFPDVPKHGKKKKELSDFSLKNAIFTYLFLRQEHICSHVA